MKIVEKTATKLTLQHRPARVWIAAGVFVLVIPFVLLLIGQNNTWLFYIWWFPLLPVAFVILGLLVLILAGGVISCGFDKTLGKVTLKRRGLLGMKVTEHSLKEIVDVQLESNSWNSDDNANYDVILFLRQSKAVPLKVYPTSSSTEKIKVVNVIREFLCLPPK